MKRPLYVCLEGLDGSGKSTVYETVLRELRQKGYRVHGLCPTKSFCDCKNKSRCRCRNIERLFNRCPALRNSRFFRQFLYAYRSNRAAKEIVWDVDLILGDRSVVTSYICRWTNSNLYNRLLVLAINCLESRIPVPDHVLYLEVPAEELHDRLSIRGGRDIDETDERSNEMRRAYEYLRGESNVVRRLRNICWHTVDGTGSKEKVAGEVLKQIEIML